MSRTQILKWSFVVSLRVLERDLILLTNDGDDDDVGTNTSLIFMYLFRVGGGGDTLTIYDKFNQRRIVKKSWIHCLQNGSSVVIGCFLILAR